MSGLNHPIEGDLWIVGGECSLLTDSCGTCIGKLVPLVLLLHHGRVLAIIERGPMTTHKCEQGEAPAVRHHLHPDFFEPVRQVEILWEVFGNSLLLATIPVKKVEFDDEHLR